jgi:hypothetical protein
MFPLTRLKRQVLASVLTVLLTIVPTAYVAVTAWRIRQPAHLRAVEVELGQSLGLQVSLEGIAYPRPGEVEYRGLVLRREEPRRRGLTELARAARVRIRRGESELVLETEGLQLEVESPRLALAEVGALLQRSGGIPYERVSLSASTCDLELGSDLAAFHVRDVVATYQSDRALPAVRASYRLGSNGSMTRCELELSRDRRADPVRTSLVLKTMEGLPLSASVLDVFCDSTAWLGAEARLEGSLTLRQTGGGDWEADFAGDLIDVDLAALVGRRFPSHRLSGLARLSIQSARWADRPGQGFGWVEARGELSARHGSIDPGLLRALQTEMKFRLPPGAAEELSARAIDVEFAALGLTFALTRDGEIQIGGRLGTDFPPGALLTTSTAPLAFAPEGAANVRGLIKSLFPVEQSNAGVLVPLTAESRVLLNLPVPAELTSRVGAN